MTEPDPYRCPHCRAHFPVPSLRAEHEPKCPQRPTATGRTRPAPLPDGAERITGL